ncbi:MAG TPA: transglutaminase family protein [Pirellulales bacterium]|jgi:transglutaminase-like putative cysteine protease
MLFHIKHTTRYNYSRTVFCEPFTVRLRPREDVSQRLLRYQLTIDPQPAGTCEYLDVEGSVATHCWFNSPTCALTITVNCVVETTRTNPFDFLLSGDALELPVRYRPEICAALTPYCSTTRSNGDPVTELARQIQTETNGQTVPFLTRVAAWISENCEKIIRCKGSPLPAETTLQTRQGSCRDLAVLFAEVARTAGLAARFVSGYQSQSETDGDGHMHAWSEVYLPGAGWRGFDPGQGVAVADHHVAVASGLDPLAAAPTVGTFRGTDASSTMDSQLVIRAS